MDNENVNSELMDSVIESIMKKMEDKRAEELHQKEVAAMTEELNTLKVENRRIADMLAQKDSNEPTFEEALSAIVGG